MRDGAEDHQPVDQDARGRDLEDEDCRQGRDRNQAAKNHEEHMFPGHRFNILPARPAPRSPRHTPDLLATGPRARRAASLAERRRPSSGRAPSAFHFENTLPRADAWPLHTMPDGGRSRSFSPRRRTAARRRSREGRYPASRSHPPNAPPAAGDRSTRGAPRTQPHRRRARSRSRTPRRGSAPPPPFPTSPSASATAQDAPARRMRTPPRRRQEAERTCAKTASSLSGHRRGRRVLDASRPPRDSRRNRPLRLYPDLRSPQRAEWPARMHVVTSPPSLRANLSVPTASRENPTPWPPFAAGSATRPVRLPAGEAASMSRSPSGRSSDSSQSDLASKPADCCRLRERRLAGGSLWAPATPRRLATASPSFAWLLPALVCGAELRSSVRGPPAWPAPTTWPFSGIRWSSTSPARNQAGCSVSASHPTAWIVTCSTWRSRICSAWASSFDSRPVWDRM